ncbi:MAG: hypothetical protein GY852_04505 [bacterium]|nr:hypothetical protein [bacterium]
MQEMSLTLVPVAHISRKSAELVRETIEQENPQLIGLELCRERLEGLVRGGSRTMDLNMALRHPTSAFMFVAQQLLGKWWHVKPGAEMLEALKTASEMEKPVALLDRPIRVTARQIEKIPLREKFGMVFSGGFKPSGKKMTLKKLMQPENLNVLLSKLEKDFPVSYGVFVDSRNKYMFRKLLFHKPESAVVVVGAAHVPGLQKLAEESEQKINVKVAR